MKIKAKTTKIKHVEVEVDHKEMFHKLSDQFSQKVGFSIRDDYIRDGKLYRWDYDNHHNGDPEYKPAIEATQEQIDVLNAIVLLAKYL